MSRFRRLLISAFFILSLGFLMGQDGFCLFLGDDVGGGGVIVSKALVP